MIAGIVRDEKGEDVEVVEPGSTEDKDAVDDIADLSFIGTTSAKRPSLMLVGDPYPVGADGFRTMKTTRPAGFTPEEWAT